MKIALIGNPNCGKTTLFNSLTGSTAKTGNWPGVTVTKKEGIYRLGKEDITIVDLPGVYSLSPYSPEEIVSRNYLLNEKPDCIINIVDVTNLERNLYLTFQLMETDCPMVIALNMVDLAKKNGEEINAGVLKKYTNLPVVEISALKKSGLDELIRACKNADKKHRQATTVLTDPLIEITEKKLAKDNALFLSIKLLEGDPLVKEENQAVYQWLSSLKTKSDGAYQEEFALTRYQFIQKNCLDVVKKAPLSEDKTKSDRIDAVLTHKIWGIPCFILIMMLVFHLTFSTDFLFLHALGIIPEGSFDLPIIGNDAIASPGMLLFQAMDFFVSWLSDVFRSWLAFAPAWCSSLLVDGLFAGVGAILSFIPNILVLFLFITILEDCGYMARVAFLMDRIFKGLGLSGKAFIPLVSCFGCAVPGIMATKTLESEKERRITIMLAPFFSCGAKLPIWTAFATVLFGGKYADLIVGGVYFFGIIVAVLMALVLNRLIKGTQAPFIMEMPEYHLPQAKNIGLLLWDKCKHYLIKAGTLIAASTIILWVLMHFNWRFEMVDAMNESILGSVSAAIAPVFIPLGFGKGPYAGVFVIAAFAGLIAKEVVPTVFVSLGVLDAAIASVSPAAIFAYMAFNLLVIPCMAATSTAKGELGHRRHFLLALLFWVLTAYFFSMVVYVVATMIEEFWWVSLILVGVVLSILVFLIVKNRLRPQTV